MSKRALAGLVVAVLAVAVIVGVQLNQRQQGVGVPIGSTASPSPAATATAAYNDDFGFVLSSPGISRTTTVRRESGAPVGSFDQEQLAVSPDGRQIAWFTPFGAQPQQLRVASAADVTRSQLLRTVSAAEHGGAIVWSDDASGLLYQTYSVEPPPGGPQPAGSPSRYAIHTVDLRDTTTPDRVVLSSPIRGLVLRPIAWDRAADVAAVVETGEGGFMISYDVIQFAGSEAVTTKKATISVPMRAFSVSASSDAKLVLGPTFVDGGTLWWWPMADFAAHQTITASGNGFWRPRTHEVATIGGCAGDPVCGPNGGVRLLDVDTGRSRIVYGASVANMGIRTFRADGSAVLVFTPQASGDDQFNYTLVPLSGSASPTTFREVNGFPTSVRLR